MTNLDSQFEAKTTPRKKSRKILWVLAIIFIIGIIYWLLLPPACDLPIKYSIGVIDGRFKFSKEDLIATLKDAETRWDIQTGKNVLEYDPNALLKISLVYDRRQAELDKLNELSAQLNQSGETIGSWNQKLDSIIYAYERDLANYNSEVQYWNIRGGAPSSIFYQLLNDQADLERRRQEINKSISSLSIQIDEHNSNLQDLKNVIEQNKNKIQTQGLYYPDTNEIVIFTFNNKEELRLVLMHEMGHSMGIEDHAKNTKSVMYPLSDIDNGPYISNPSLTQEDIVLLTSKCNLN